LAGSYALSCAIADGETPTTKHKSAAPATEYLSEFRHGRLEGIMFLSLCS
jgi:hypothetical protein